ncbi:hypothetical protein FDENT_1178 [Fusarium denticulatum]|uniref:BAH domain-containing protein n=1 Tax=Fusarium denticulatum TaxID=48507 RepID=A0A8H5XIN7_9HYPO|nr:hypothetical protein FDENT_1178 [Fusarium denticulatum]
MMINGLTFSDDWVAYILEIRASDEHHVYARVYWMYWPYELPLGTIDGKQKFQGRQPYHGANELIASNHMDIIDVVSVTEPVTVRHWNESDDEEIQDGFYWRQAYDCRNSELLSVELICRCQTPANPDRTLIGFYEQLGTDKPHRTEGSVAREEISEEATHPQSPADAEQRETQPTTDDCSRETQKNFYVKNGIRETLHKTIILTSGSIPSSSTTTALVKGPAKRSRKTNIADFKPYIGLFEASVKMQNGPTAWEINDLRDNVIGSDRTWTENARCLLCGAIID